MTPKIIQNESDYESACSRIYELIHSDIEKGTPEGNELEVLSLLVENYETKHQLASQNQEIPTRNLNKVLPFKSHKNSFF